MTENRLGVVGIRGKSGRLFLPSSASSSPVATFSLHLLAGDVLSSNVSESLYSSSSATLSATVGNVEFLPLDGGVRVREDLGVIRRTLDWEAYEFARDGDELCEGDNGGGDESDPRL